MDDPLGASVSGAEAVVFAAHELAETLRATPGFEIVTDPILSIFSFAVPGDDVAQQRFVDAVNADGRIYITQGMHDGRKMIRFQVGQFDTTRADVQHAAVVMVEVLAGLQAG